MDFEITDGVLVHYLGEDEDVVIPEGVERISSGAFDHKRSIKSISFPASLKAIDEYTFGYYCDFSAVHIPDLLSWLNIKATEFGASPFGNCTDLYINGQKVETIVIPGEAKIIRKRAFSKCASIKHVIIEEGITSIGEDAFSECENLQSISLPSSIKKIEAGAFYDCEELSNVVIADIASWISADKGDYGGNPLQNKQSALYIDSQCVQINSIPDGVKSIGSNTFLDCNYLEEIIIPQSVTKIGKCAFSGCSSLRNVVLPEGIDKISESTFANCSSLQEITIPTNVKQISKEAFNRCKSLVSVLFPQKLEKMGDSVFRECSSLKEITIPSQTTSIGRDSFRDCKSLSTVVLHNLITKIGEGAFWGCESLREVSLPKGIQTISKNLMRECSALETISIPEQISSIEDHAFSDCSRLGEILIYAPRIRLGKDAFSGCKAIHKLNIPERMIGFNKYTFNEPDYVYIINLPYASVPQQLQPAALKGIAYAKINDEEIDEHIYDSYRKSINRHKDDWIYEGKIDENEIFIRFLIHEEMLDASETEHLIKRVTKYDLPELLNMLMIYQTNHFEPEDYTGLLDNEFNI